MGRNSRKAQAAKVLIVDDHPAVREALTYRISQVHDLEVCGEASDIPQALALVTEKEPDIAVIDISLKTGNDGLDLIKRIKARGSTMRMLVWSMYPDNLYAERTLRAGALGYINKEQAMEQIIKAIHQVLEGKVYLSESMKEKVLLRSVGEGVEGFKASPVDSLSDRELAVFRLIGQGNKTADIAACLHLSIKTVETYRDRIREKLNLSDGTELAHRAIEWVNENH